MHFCFCCFFSAKIPTSLSTATLQQSANYYGLKKKKAKIATHTTLCNFFYDLKEKKVPKPICSPVQFLKHTVVSRVYSYISLYYYNQKCYTSSFRQHSSITILNSGKGITSHLSSNSWEHLPLSNSRLNLKFYWLKSI